MDAIYWKRLWDGRGERSCTFLFDVLPLAGLCSLRDGLAEEGHELAIAAARTMYQRRRFPQKAGLLYLSLVNLE